MMPVVKNEEQFEHWVKAYPFYENIQNSFARIGHGFICYKFLGYRLSGFMGKKQPVGLPPYIGCFHYRYFRTTDGQTGYKE